MRIQRSIEPGPNGSLIHKLFVRLAGWFLTLAQRYSEGASKAAAAEASFEASVLTVIFASLAIEAAANELAESEIPASDRSDFERCRDAYKRPKIGRIAEAVWRWHHLLARRGDVVSVQDEPLKSAQDLFDVRNALMHYKADENYLRAVVENAQVQPPVGGPHVIEWRFDLPPSQIEPSYIEREVNPDAAKRHVAAAKALFDYWNDLEQRTRKPSP